MPFRIQGRTESKATAKPLTSAKVKINIMGNENTETKPNSSGKLSPCYAIHRKRYLQSTYGEESKWVTTDKRIKIMGKIGIFAMVCEEQGMPYVVEISEIIPLG
jgi:hypothetical protein